MSTKPVAPQTTAVSNTTLNQHLSLPRRALAYLLSRSLNALGAIDVASFLKGKEKGIEQGTEAGKSEGELIGFNDGYAAGHAVLEFNDLRTVAPLPGEDHCLFDDEVLPITDLIKQKMRAEVAQKLPDDEQPSPEQWAMIFADTTCTSVIAGAGSGKSTTLALRVLLMNIHLGIERSHLQVTTFTTESKMDLKKKIVKIFKLWEIELSEEETKNLVRTFHSKVFWFMKAFSDGPIGYFDFLGPNASDDDEELENPFSSTITTEQRVVLYRVFNTLYEQNADFKKQILELYKSVAFAPAEPMTDAMRKSRKKIIKAISEKDSAVCDEIEKAWATLGLWPIPGIGERQVITIEGHPFIANGYLKEYDAVLILGWPDAGDRNAEVPTRDGERYTLKQESRSRQSVIGECYAKNFLLLNHVTAAQTLLDNAKHMVVQAPKFDYHLPGTTLKETDLIEVFFSEGNYIENLGLDVDKAIGAMKFAPGDPRKPFYLALKCFWKGFHAYLRTMSPKPLITFNQAFALFGEQNPENIKRIPTAQLDGMRHLMIDEFQDVSGLNISWIRQCCKEIRRRNQGKPGVGNTLMAVGDDWQSIYGWRGSSPLYLIDFHQHFLAHTRDTLFMQNNYRSHQAIIDAAEQVVRPTSNDTTKHGVAANTNVIDQISPVYLHYLAQNKKIIQPDETILSLVKQAYDDGDTILMVFRVGAVEKAYRNELRGLLSDARRQKRNVKLMTFHKSKGLQAQSVFVIGDCFYIPTKSKRNDLYNLANLGDGKSMPYDRAQSDEVLRLAYVGITRAELRCHWLVDREITTSDKNSGNNASGYANLKSGCYKKWTANESSGVSTL
ncbi:UvrD-helicase domain-containing protein [Pseudomonas sp. dw_612]|uniref:UvrD-helicase domain-containing protein n=1 Tax=Pseudomonas sp. dw_612 TaxID=2720080 RepID=UPI001BD29747|nr:UvrD-helicase domain-containing protein [Pseudomonas sp. dw_612]